MVSEEMRLIYVALTRAKEQLFLIGRVKDEKELTQLEQVSVSENIYQSVIGLQPKDRLI